MGTAACLATAFSEEFDLGARLKLGPAVGSVTRPWTPPLALGCGAPAIGGPLGVGLGVLDGGGAGVGLTWAELGVSGKRTSIQS